jgi:translation initiation factor IF-1
MEAEERFVLDAAVESVINHRAFRARLANGHEFVAFEAGPMAEGGQKGLRPGCRIRVEFSPCDLSKARIVGQVESEGAG